MPPPASGQSSRETQGGQSKEVVADAERAEHELVISWAGGRSDLTHPGTHRSRPPARDRIPDKVTCSPRARSRARAPLDTPETSPGPSFPPVLDRHPDVGSRQRCLDPRDPLTAVLVLHADASEMGVPNTLAWLARRLP